MEGDIFVKIGTGGTATELNLLKCELLGLEHLEKLAQGLPIAVPKPVAAGSVDDGRDAFIAMEYMAFCPPLGSRTQGQADFGKGLALLHSQRPLTWRTFGFPMDGCCGAGPQPNNMEGVEMNWVDFWREHRLGAQLAELKRQHGTDNEVQELGAQLSKRLDELFGGAGLIVEDIPLSILHGDLWAGNVDFARESRTGKVLPCIFDPAPYYGHAEADLGIMWMFGRPSEPFLEAYHKVLPKQPGHERRAVLYELHHHMNHYNIFGGGYRSGVISLIQQLLR